MSKNKTDKKINRIVKKINKQLQEDVFKDRFWIKQICKQRVDGLNYYLYELKDRLEPERDSVFSKGWLWGDSNFLISDFYNEINNFIVMSDFWSLYYKDPTRYDKDLDEYLWCFNKLGGK